VHCPNRDVSVECEAPETYHDGMDASSDLVQHVTLKYHCGMWPSTADFFLAFYADKYQTRLWEVWRVVIHSMRVVDTRAMLGQASNADLLLALSEGYDRNRRRLVQCFASDPLRVKFRPAGVFSMSANAITKTSLSFVPRRSGDLELQVHAVDVESRSLVGAWIVRASVSAPPVTKTFDVELSTGTQSTKRVVFENKWDTTRIFVVTTNDSDRIRIKTPRLAMSAKGRNYLRLEFVPRDVVEAAEAFVFVSGQDGQIEECILFRLNYVL
jgi:nephrocystin-4